MVELVRDLIARSIAGDEQAMIELVQRYQGQVFGLCYRMLSNRQDAEDVTQEVFVRMFRNLARWDQERDFRPWLLAIAGNRCRTTLSARKRRPPASRLLDDPPHQSADAIQRRGLAEELEVVIDQLRDDYRQAFLLFHAEQLSYAEISLVMDRPVGTVKTWIHRARRELARSLQTRGILGKARHELTTL